MLDLRLIREKKEEFVISLKKRGEPEAILDELLSLDAEYREILKEVEHARAQKNKMSKEIASLKKNGKSAKIEIDAMKELGEKMKSDEEKAGDLRNRINYILYRIPNKLHESVPEGKSDADNPVVKEWGELPRFDFNPLPHWELGEMLNIIDIKRGSKLSGSGFILYKNAGAKLKRALINWMLDLHTTKNGFKEVSPPFIVRPEIMVGTGQLPKFADDMYYVEKDDLYLIPTAEVPVTNIYRDEVLKKEDLPLSFVAYTPCFRREAGSYGKDTRGIIRVHQFDKVEMVKIVEPEKSYEVHEELVRYAEEILEMLNLPYQKVLLCSGDTGFSAAKCYDLNVYAAGLDKFLEVSSISNFEDFQARRMNLRYKPTANSKPVFVHTLNGSGLALPRLMIAIIENNQTKDGKIKVPEVLKPYMGGISYIE